MSRTAFLSRSCIVALAIASLSALETWAFDPASNATHRCSIRISDPSGTAIPHARVRVIPAPDAPPAAMETDGEGRLALNLRSGGYGAFVSAPGFKSAAVHLEVRETADLQTFPVTLEIRSTANPVVQATKPSADGLTLSASPYHDPVTLTAAQLKTMPHTSVTVQNPHSGATETYSGVGVAELFGKLGAPLGKEFRGITMTTGIIATGKDGYQVLLSLAEVDPSFHPGLVVVADSLNGQPLDANSGPFKLVVSEDKRPARAVRNLMSLELRLF